MKSEHEKMLERSSSQAKVIGNRLANRISMQTKKDLLSEGKMATLTAPYMANSLDQVNIYNNKLETLFSRYIASHLYDKKDTLNHLTARTVIKDQFSDLIYLEKDKHIIGYFPIDIPSSEASFLLKQKGVLHLVFDVAKEYQDMRRSIITTAIGNVLIIIILLLIFSFLMYFLVFKRLNALHKASLMLSDGDFKVQVKSKGNDELTQVIHTFNTMATQMDAYKHTMEETVDKALKEQIEQNKLLVQQSRMASMGEMIGNIAHQWRQPLNALGLIIQKIELFSKRGKLTHEMIKENAEKAVTIISSMSTTIDDFRDFFKPDKQMEYFDLKTIVHNVTSILEAGLEKADIEIDVNIAQPSCEIYGFKNEFSQVIINLINNSKDALVENQIKDKKITITGIQNRDKVTLTIQDNAGGIPDQIIERIFDPYYTTKEEGKGTGIGLYMSKMIIEDNMQGSIQVKNSEDGAKFIMVFKNKKVKQ